MRLGSLTSPASQSSSSSHYCSQSSSKNVNPWQHVTKVAPVAAGGTRNRLGPGAPGHRANNTAAAARLSASQTIAADTAEVQTLLVHVVRPNGRKRGKPHDQEHPRGGQPLLGHHEEQLEPPPFQDPCCSSCFAAVQLAAVTTRPREKHQEQLQQLQTKGLQQATQGWHGSPEGATAVTPGHLTTGTAASSNTPTASGSLSILSNGSAARADKDAAAADQQPATLNSSSSSTGSMPGAEGAHEGTQSSASEHTAVTSPSAESWLASRQHSHATASCSSRDAWTSQEQLQGWRYCPREGVARTAMGTLYLRMTSQGRPQAVATAAASQLLQEGSVVVSAAGDLCAQLALEALTLLPRALQRQRRGKLRSQSKQEKQGPPLQAQQQQQRGQQQATQPDRRLRTSVEVVPNSQPGRYGKLQLYNFQLQLEQVAPAAAAAAAAGAAPASSSSAAAAPGKGPEAPAAAAAGSELAVAHTTLALPAAGGGATWEESAGGPGRPRHWSPGPARPKQQQQQCGTAEAGHLGAAAGAARGGSHHTWQQHVQGPCQGGRAGRQEGLGVGFQAGHSGHGTVGTAPSDWQPLSGTGFLAAPSPSHCSNSSSSSRHHGSSRQKGLEAVGGSLAHAGQLEQVPRGGGLRGGGGVVLEEQCNSSRGGSTSSSSISSAWQEQAPCLHAGTSRGFRGRLEVQGWLGEFEELSRSGSNKGWGASQLGQSTWENGSQEQGTCLEHLAQGRDQHQQQQQERTASSPKLSRWDEQGKKASKQQLAAPAADVGLGEGLGQRAPTLAKRGLASRSVGRTEEVILVSGGSLDMADEIMARLQAHGCAQVAVAYRKHVGRVLQAAAVVQRRMVRERGQQLRCRPSGEAEGVSGPALGSRLCFVCQAGKVPRATGSKPGTHFYFYML